MKKVLIITYYWPPSGGGGVQRWVKFTKYLAKFNIEPIVLTVDTDCASYALLDSSLLNEVDDNLSVYTTRSREPFNFYKKFTSKKEIPFAGFANEDNPGFLQIISRFIRGNFFIPDARIGWNAFAYKKALEIINKHQIVTVITSSPPHSTQLIGLKLKKKLGLHWIADMRDPWTDIYYYDKLFHSSIARKIDRRKEAQVLQHADNVVVVSKSIKELFASKIAPGESKKISVIPNGYDETDFHAIEKRRNSKFTITYTGTLADNYHIEGFLDALIALVKSQGDLKVALQFVGRVSENYRKMIEHSVLNEMTTYTGHVDHAASIAYLQHADALFLAIPDMPQNEGILTGKLFEYLAARKPIVAIGPVHGDASLIIDECSAGKMFPYSDTKNIEGYINDLFLVWNESRVLDLKGEAYRNYSRENLTKMLAKLIP